MTADILIAPPQEVIDFLALPKGPKKNVLFEKLNHKQFVVSGGLTKEDSISFYYHWMKVFNQSGSCYMKATKKYGLTFKDKKLSIWFGRDMRGELSFDFYSKLVDYMRWDFLKNDVQFDLLVPYITKGILEKIFKGKITNVRSLLAEYAKATRIKVSTELFYNAVKTHGLGRVEFISFAKSAKDPNHFLEWFNQHSSISKQSGGYHSSYDNIRDLCKQFRILEKKVDFKWSEKRIAEEHEKATRELMDYEIDDLSDDVIKYPDLNYPKEFHLLDTEKKLYMEGRLMNHCVYTNYAPSVKSKNYLAFHVSLDGEEATLGVSYNGTGLLFHQVYRKHNQQASEKMTAFCKGWVEKQNKPKIVSGIF